MSKINIFKEMNYLVGDIGNTSTKICLVNKNSKIIKEYSVETKQLSVKINIYKFFYSSFKKKNKKQNTFLKRCTKNLQ